MVLAEVLNAFGLTGAAQAVVEVFLTFGGVAGLYYAFKTWVTNSKEK
jgi:hypothetical protein